MLPAALALALLLPLAPIGIQADPGCAGGSACSVPSSGLAGFVPPVVVVASGGTVQWTSLDSAHVNEEGALATPAEDPCFSVVYSGAVPDAATFRYEGGQVTAAGADGVSRPCTTAVAADAAAFVHYRCIIHPFTMKGVVVVLAA